MAIFQDTVTMQWNWTGAYVPDVDILDMLWSWTGIIQDRPVYAPSGRVQTVSSTVKAVPG